MIENLSDHKISLANLKAWVFLVEFYVASINKLLMHYYDTQSSIKYKSGKV